MDRAVARLFAARARQEALRRNRDGDFDGARRILDGTRGRIEGYAGDDPDLRSLIGTLASEKLVYAAPMAEASRNRSTTPAPTSCAAATRSGHSIKRA